MAHKPPPIINPRDAGSGVAIGPGAAENEPEPEALNVPLGYAVPFVTVPTAKLGTTELRLKEEASRLWLAKFI